MKRYLSLLLSLSLALALCACGNSQAPAAQEQEKSIACCTDGSPLDDNGFYQGVWAAVQAYGTENGLSCRGYVPDSGAAQAREAVLRQAVESGAAVVTAAGWGWTGEIVRLAKAYPNTAFLALAVSGGEALTDSGEAALPSNLRCVLFHEEQSGYAAGYAAVKEGYTQLGFVGGGEAPPIARYGIGFLQGAAAAADENQVPVRVNYYDSSPQDKTLSAKAEDWYTGGTEIVFACGGNTLSTVLPIAAEYDGMVIGGETDQRAQGDGHAYNPVLTSATVDWKGAVNAGLHDCLTSEGGGSVEQPITAEAGGLPTDRSAWGFQSYTTEQYLTLVSQLTDGTRSVTSEIKPPACFATDYLTVQVQED